MLQHSSPSSIAQLRPWPSLRSWWWAGIGTIIFAATVLAGLMIKNAGSRAAELNVDVGLSHDRNPVLTVMSLAIHYGLGPVGAIVLLLVCCLGLWMSRRSIVPALMFGSVVSIGWLSSEAGKHLVARMRPPADTVQALVQERGMDSFPSGHTAFAVALVWAFVLVVARTRRARMWALVAGVVLVAWVAFSRLYLGVHYPSDVVASVLIASGAILIWLPVWNNLIEPRLGQAPPARTSPSHRAGGGADGTMAVQGMATDPGIWPTIPIGSRAIPAGTRTGQLRSKNPG